MTKTSRRFVIAAVVIVLVIYLVLSFSLGWVVKTAVNRVGPGITQTKVELAGAHISPLTGSGVLSGLTVGNPPGWSSANAFYLGRISISLKPFSIFGDHIVIDDLDIDQPEFVYETKILSSNIGDLLKNMGSGKADTAATKSNGRPVKFEVKHLRLTRGKVTLGVGEKELPLPLPTIELRDLGAAEGGITADQLAVAVMKSVSTEIIGTTAQAAGKIGSTAGAAAAESLKKTGENLKKLWGK
jgi:hypothetical protein